MERRNEVSYSAWTRRKRRPRRERSKCGRGPELGDCHEFQTGMPEVVCKGSNFSKFGSF